MKVDRTCFPVVRTGVALLAFTALSSAAPIIIDDFSTNQVQNLTNSGGNPKNGQVAGSTAAGGIGGQREFSLTRTLGSGTAQLDSNGIAPGFLSYQSSDNSDAQFLVVWDGPGGLASTAANLASLTNLTFALGNIDLTDGGTNNRIRFRADADNNGNVPLTIRIYQSAGKYAEASATINGDLGFSLDAHDILYTEFVGFGLGGGETALDIIRNANAIALFGNPPAAADLSIDLIESGSGIPEPTTFALIGSAILALGFARRRLS
jgi:hypothetical protein